MNDYYSCPYIEGGIVFQNNGFTTCCSVRNGHNWPLLYNYDINSQGFPINEIIESRNLIKEANKKDEKFVNCKKCRTLTKKNWEEKEYLFDLVSVQNDLNCNLLCEYCNFIFKWNDLQKQEKTYALYPIFTQMIQNKWLSPKAQIFWAGGEPTLLDEFPECLELLFNYSTDIKLQIASNTTCIPDKLINICKKYGKNINVLCSLDSGSPEVYLQVKKRNYFNKVVENLGLYKKIVNEVYLKMIIIHTNINDIYSFIKTAKSLNIKNVFYDIDCTQDMGSVPQEFLDAICCFIWESLSNGIIAAPASLWEFYDIIEERLEKTKSSYFSHKRTLINDEKKHSFEISVTGKNASSFSQEAYFLNIGSDVEVIPEINSFVIEGNHQIKNEPLSPSGKGIMLLDETSKIKFQISAKKLNLLCLTSPWSGVIKIKIGERVFDVDLYSVESKHMIYEIKL